MPYENLIYEKKGHLAYITINRPRVLNAVNPPTQRELIHAFHDFRDDPEMWVAIITGAGDRAFSAGADIKWGAEHPEERGARRKGRPLFGHLDSMMAGCIPLEIWKPIIAAVNGYALGGGCEICLACDIIIASENASFGLPEVTHGWPPGSGVFKLPRQIPLKLAMEMLFTGDRISAQEAYRRGLVNKVVSLSELMAEATKLAERICENPPLGVRAAKELAMRGLDMPLDYPPFAWHIRMDSVNRVYEDSEDVEEGRRAFVEKRKPVFRGR